MILELEPAEVAMLGHALRMVPSNAVLTGTSLANLAPGKGLAFFYEIPAYTSLWNKIAKVVATSGEMESFRKQEK